MQTPLQVSFRHMGPSDAVEDYVREKVAGLSKFSERMISCHVVITAAKRHRKGNHHEVEIVITVPGKEIVVNRGTGQQDEYEDIYVTLRDAFDAARRQLEDHASYQRGETKTHYYPTEPTKGGKLVAEINSQK